MKQRSTEIDHLSGGTWASIAHRNVTVRYFNGRRYETRAQHSFMSSPLPNGKVLYWMNYHRYISIVPDAPFAIGSKWHTYKSRSVFTPGPSILKRTIAAMVPDDIQAVPF
jgi:hypothetical protein